MSETDLVKVNRVLMSVSDKTGVVGLAKSLTSMGCSIISTGGTGRALQEKGISFMDVSGFSGDPEAFSGRMKTLSYNVMSAILFDREKDREEARKLGIEQIDMVVCNLYPFEKVMNEGAEFETLVENIDIGGPTMIRAAAKNHRFVTVVVSPDDYDEIVSCMKENDGCTTYELRKRLMRKAYSRTADYDSTISVEMNRRDGVESCRLSYDNGMPLRYGENPHQKASLFGREGLFDVLAGKELSYNNMVDLCSAVEAVRSLARNACVVVKHSNPCGMAECDSQRDAIEQAWAGDSVSAFGSIIAFNSRVSKKTMEFLELDDKQNRKFVEIIVAPDFDEDAVAYMKKFKSLRIVRLDPSKIFDSKMKRFAGKMLLVQDRDELLMEGVACATSEGVRFDDKGLLDFGINAVRALKSNAIAVVRRLGNGGYQLIGMGCGQPNRVIATEHALKRSRENLEKSYGIGLEVADVMSEAILVSDAFFPFADSIDLCAEYGITRIVQPGGSIRDKEVIERCRELEIEMFLTGTRHFNH